MSLRSNSCGTNRQSMSSGNLNSTRKEQPNMNVIKKLEEKLAMYEKKIKEIDAILATLPKGNLKVYRHSKSLKMTMKYSHKNPITDKTEETHIKKGEESFAAALSMRKQLKQRKKAYQASSKNIRKYLKAYTKEPSEFIKSKYFAEYKRLTDEYYPDSNIALQEQLNKKYETLEPDPTTHKIETSAGIMVRSKSEAIILDMLYALGIPFVYEPKITLPDGKVVYPDFIIVDPCTHAEYMWEHLGLLDKQSYVDNTFRKLAALNELGWYIGINLIITSETDTHKFASRKARDTIEQHFIIAA